MDIDEALLRARVALVHLRALQDRDAEHETQAELLAEIADAFEVIDESLTKDGFPPTAWERRRS